MDRRLPDAVSLPTKPAREKNAHVAAAVDVVATVETVVGTEDTEAVDTAGTVVATEVDMVAVETAIDCPRCTPQSVEQGGPEAP
tara:strand:- start:42 stop:293 length:252 start_codon:yes stop_codon:yes gene_type:complete